MRYKNRYNTNNVNICVNVSNNVGSGSGSSNPDISQFENKIAAMSTDINLLKSNVENLSSDDYFELKLNKFLTYQEREKIKSLTSKYDEINDLLSSNIASIEYKETEIHFVEYGETSGVVIEAEIDGKWITLNDTTNADNDEDTLYKLPVNGYVIGIEIYTSNEGSVRETFEGIKTSYNPETGISTIFMNKGDYDLVYGKRPNNKIFVHTLLIK